MYGYSALQTGLAFLLPVVVMFVGSLAGGRILTRLGARTTFVTFLAIGAAGALLLATAISTGGGYAPLVPGLVLLSVGQGVVYTAMFAAASVSVPGPDQGVASGLVSTGDQVGNAVGLAVLIAVAGIGSDGASDAALRASTSAGVRTAVFAIAAGIALSILLASGFRRAAAPTTAESPANSSH